SGPSVVSTLGNISKENTGNFTYTFSHSGKISAFNPLFASYSPTIARVAILDIVTPVILLKNGTVRDDLGFNSITYTSSSLMMNWMFYNPTIFNSFAILSVASKHFCFTTSLKRCGGYTAIESPE